ncbi:hypothetical protein [Maridesulfovibrio sp.]|uniref:hypothetical protein n=1 Tax=Maridesulfovibrio sp. TaxID=2795000 RepID=UPI002AA92A92|nr:hypothetical protein [Maridesulfovibrio sp.]
MFKQKEWLFQGESGKEYTFGIYAKTRPIPEHSGLYILSYTHPRGHRSGFKVNMLYAGETENFSKTIAAPPQADCLWDENWNCIYLLINDNPDERRNILSDLIAGNKISCQN